MRKDITFEKITFGGEKLNKSIKLHYKIIINFFQISC